MPSAERTAPVIVLTGTPGTGKSTHAELLIASSPLKFKHIDVSNLVKTKGLHDGYDEEWDTYEANEDKVLDELEIQVDEAASEGCGLVLDWHQCDLYPERWADLVIVLRCDHTVLWDRLEKRNYSTKKIEENNECEIMQTVLDEARGSFPEEIVIELKSETTEDLESNVERIMEWVKAWRRERGSADAS